MSSRKNIILVGFLFIPLIMYPQSGYFNNLYQINNGIWSIENSIVEVENGYLIGGATGLSSNDDWHQINLILLDLDGNKIEEKFIGDINSEYYIARKSLIKSYNNSIYFSGSRRTYFPDFPFDEALVIKLNNEYDTIWAKFFGEQIEPYDSAYNPRGFIETSDSCFMMVGIMTPKFDYKDKLFLIKTDEEGNKLSEWLYSYPGPLWKLRGFSVIETSDKGFAIGAYRFKPGYNYTGEPMVYKVDSLGNEEWHINVGGPIFDTKSLLCNGWDGSIMEVNCYADSMSDDWDAYRTINVKKIDLEGNIVWDKRYGGSEYDKYVSNIRPTSDGGYIVAGYTTSAQLGYSYPFISGWMLKINNDGDSLWYRLKYNLTDNSGHNYLYDIIPTSDNGFAACGEVFGSSTNYTQHAWVLKVDSMGCDTPGCATGVQVFDIPAGDQQEIRVWPNPASGVFQVSSRSFGTRFQADSPHIIRVYNAQGVKVEEVEMSAHTESISLDATGWNRGLYFVRVVCGNEMNSFKLIVN